MMTTTNPLPAHTSALTQIRFTKISGAGNTFALAHINEKSNLNEALQAANLSMPELARLVCGVQSGFACDGLLVLKPGANKSEFIWDFFNSDGSGAEMCGNAARCAARYVHDYLTALNSMIFKTGAGPVGVEYAGPELINVQMPPCTFVKQELELTLAGQKQKYFLVNSGVPHLVSEAKSISPQDLNRSHASLLRHHADLQPSGANVTYFVSHSSNKIEAVTYERGVEDFTLACGTGAVAAAYVQKVLQNKSDITVQMPGGALRVLFSEQDPRPHLIGGARIIGHFYIQGEV